MKLLTSLDPFTKPTQLLLSLLLLIVLKSPPMIHGQANEFFIAKRSIPNIF
ncbi:hypothetical protein V6Z11_A05G172300 [Gossypium hirsutum]